MENPKNPNGPREPKSLTSTQKDRPDQLSDTITTDPVPGTSSGHSQLKQGPEEPQSPTTNQGVQKPETPTQKMSKVKSGNSARPMNTSSRPSLEDMFGTRKFNRFFTVKPNGESNLTRLNMFKVDKAIRNQIGICEKISEDYQNRSWTVEVKSEEQGKKLKEMTILLQESVTVIPHETYNQSKGVITCSMLKGYSDEDIAEGLAEHGVIQCKRIIRNPKSQLPDPTNTLILTFNTSTPPDSVNIRTGLRERVRPYIPLPRRCFNCQQYGHSGAKCRRALPVCARCGGDADENHKAETCQLPINCIHCKQPHNVSAKNCPKYIYEKEVITLKTKENLTFAEARAKVNITHNSRTRTYATVTNQESSKSIQPPTTTDINNNSSRNHYENDYHKTKTTTKRRLDRSKSSSTEQLKSQPSKSNKQPKTDDNSSISEVQGNLEIMEATVPPEIMEATEPPDRGERRRSLNDAPEHSRSRSRTRTETDIWNSVRKASRGKKILPKQ